MFQTLNLIRDKWILCTICTLLIITTLSLWPAEELPSLPGTDKTHHFIAYAILMFPTALRKPDRWVLLGVLFIAYGGVIEILQPYVNRYGDWRDMAANTMGVLCGWIIAELTNRLRLFFTN